MKIQKFKDDYAREKGFDDWADLKGQTDFPDYDDLMERYAEIAHGHGWRQGYKEGLSDGANGYDRAYRYHTGSFWSKFLKK